MTAEALRELLVALETEIEQVRRTLLRYEREIDPASAYVLADYLDALRLDAREAADHGDAAGVRAVRDDVRQLLHDTDGRLEDAGPPQRGREEPPSDGENESSDGAR